MVNINKDRRRSEPAEEIIACRAPLSVSRGFDTSLSYLRVPAPLGNDDEDEDEDGAVCEKPSARLWRLDLPACCSTGLDGAAGGDPARPDPIPTRSRAVTKHNCTDGQRLVAGRRR